jgi:hypothetical protein
MPGGAGVATAADMAAAVAAALDIADDAAGRFPANMGVSTAE